MLSDGDVGLWQLNTVFRKRICRIEGRSCRPVKTASLFRGQEWTGEPADSSEPRKTRTQWRNEVVERVICNAIARLEDSSSKQARIWVFGCP
jgi:hypothetical protein